MIASLLLQNAITGIALLAWSVALVLFALNRCGVLPRRGRAIRVYGVSKAEAQARILIALRRLRSYDARSAYSLSTAKDGIEEDAVFGGIQRTSLGLFFWRKGPIEAASPFMMTSLNRKNAEQSLA